jgi:hypothetical protein
MDFAVAFGNNGVHIFPNQITLFAFDEFAEAAADSIDDEFVLAFARIRLSFVKETFD